jgi:hypothetical protein
MSVRKVHLTGRASYSFESGCCVNRSQGLPAELEFFLGAPSIRSILIRGDPGTGRTLLARALLESFAGQRVFVSDSERPTPEAEDARAAANPPKVQYLSMEEFQTPSSPSEFARISGVIRDPALPRRKLSDVLNPAAAAPSGAAAAPASQQMVVIDRWRSLVEHLRAARMARGHHTTLLAEEEERGILRSLLGRSDKLVIVSRNGSDTAIDDLADGIVQLRQEFVDDRMERWLQIVKMRGMSPHRSMHPFTLVDGHFRSFSEFPYQQGLRVVTAEPDPEPGLPTMWPGSSALANAFGRFPTGAITLIEMDTQVPFGVQYTLSIPFVVATIRAKGRVTAVPPPMIRPERLWENFRSEISPERAAEDRERVPAQLRVLSHFGARSADQVFAQSVVPLRPPGERSVGGPPLMHEAPVSGGEIPWDSPRARFPHLFRFTAENPMDRPNGIVLAVDGLVAAAREIGSGYTPGALAAVLQREVAGYPLHIMVWSPVQDPLVRPLEAIASLHLRLRAKQGHFLLYGVRPWTTSYLLQPAEPTTSPDGPPFELVSIR